LGNIGSHPDLTSGGGEPQAKDAKWEEFLREIRAVAHSFVMEWNHITDHDLERYYLGMLRDESELAALEEHILACGSCAERADQAQDYVDAMRIAALELIDSY
jgi:hypothetical protein